MGFSCMNGRLRRVKVPSSIPHDNNNDTQSQIISLLPFTLPNGIITTHQVSPPNPDPNPTPTNRTSEKQKDEEGPNKNTNDKFGNDGSDNKRRRIYNAVPFMLHHLKEVHRIKGELIADHCWSIIKNEDGNKSQSDREGDEAGKSSEDFSLVLAVLTRLGPMQEGVEKKRETRSANTNANNMSAEGTSTTVCTVFLYTRPFDSRNNNNLQGNNNESKFGNCSIDCESDGTNPSLFTTSNRIDVSYFVNGITMDDNILVIGSYAGATIYNIHDVLMLNKEQKSGNDDNGGENDHNEMNQNHDDHGNDSQFESSSSLVSINIMKSCVVQAMCISYPYFAAASGGRVGIWRVNYFLEYLHQQKEQKAHEDEHEANLGETAQFQLQQKYLTAIWNDKVNNCQSRITCIEMTEGEDAGNILAMSCWDGSAFVFRRQNIECDTEGEDIHKEQWDRVIPKEPSVGNGNCGERFGKKLRSWEDPIVDSDIVFPTFLTLCLVTLGAKVQRVMVVSCPGSLIARCYDIDLGEWLQDIGTPSYNEATETASCQVHGVVSVARQISSLEDERVCHIFWVDENDMIHEYLW